MNCDCAFNIGSTHDVCQDYALSGEYAISVADGCSGSVLSDFGSRVLSIMAMNKMSEIESLKEFDENEIILMSRPSARVLNIPFECLDSTLMCAYKSKDTAEIVCYGDGVIAIKLSNKDIMVISIEYVDNYPFYINYLYDKSGRYEEWMKNHNNKKISFSVIKENGEIVVISDNCDINTRLSYNKTEIGMLFISPNKINIEVLIQGIESISIMSDGIQSFYKTITQGTSKHNEKVPYFVVLKEIVDFKNYVGKFVQRRINKFVKTCEQNNWHHADDISIATMYLGE